jgi:hypothetical protein
MFLTVGTMIELPRACVVANRIARLADFFSFATNDLTQTALGFSRDDAESMFVPVCQQRKIIDRSPFETIDDVGVAWLVRLAAWVGREASPRLTLGVCGEHGGDPDSIAFFDQAGLDYVSCFALPRPDRTHRRRPVARDGGARVTFRAGGTWQGGPLTVAIRYGYKASAEQFGPRKLLELSVAAERLGFDEVAVDRGTGPAAATSSMIPSSERPPDPPTVGAAAPGPA